MYVREWNNMQYASAAAFLAAVYSDYLSAANAKLTCPDGQIQPLELFNFAKSQVCIHKKSFLENFDILCQDFVRYWFYFSLLIAVPTG